MNLKCYYTTVVRNSEMVSTFLPSFKKQLFTLSELNNVELIGIRLICYTSTLRRPPKTNVKTGGIDSSLTPWDPGIPISERGNYEKFCRSDI